MLHRLRIENLVLIREADLELAPGLNAITGETGAGKTILAQAVGLLLGAKGDAADVGPASSEAYVEAELDLPDAALEDDEVAALGDLRPEDETGLLLGRRISAHGRTRAYAWGRSIAREDLAAAAERFIAMSGQFEQRRLARPAYQLDVLDGFLGDDQLRRRAELRRAWRELLAARRRHEEVARGRAQDEERVAELHALADAGRGLTDGLEDDLRAERERLRHVTELAAAAATAVESLVPDDGAGAAALVAGAGRALEEVAEIAPELETASAELADLEIRLREAGSELRAFAASLEAEPDRLEQVEAELGRIAAAKRRFGFGSYRELVAAARAAADEVAAADSSADPVEAAARALADASARAEGLAAELRAARGRAAASFADAVAAELRAMGMADAEFFAELGERELGPTGNDEVSFRVRLNPGLPPAPVSETASGGELSRIALAIATVSAGSHEATGDGSRTMIFDEIDAGVGGQTAHAVGDALRRLAERAQVVTITHLPQIASRADRHFRVEKVAGDPTHTRIEVLDDEARRDELERMVGGKELLALLADEQTG